MVARIPGDKIKRTVAMIDKALVDSSRGSSNSNSNHVSCSTGNVRAGESRWWQAHAEDKKARWIAVDDVQVLLGLIGFCGQILVSGRWRTAWTVMALRIAVKKGFAPMNGYWMEELQWWRGLLLEMNRRDFKAMMIAPEWQLPMHANDLSPFTDASKSSLAGGGGAVFGKMAMAFRFTYEELAWLEIVDLEGLVVVLWLGILTQVCPEKLAGKRFHAWCDNKAIVAAVNNHKSSAPTIAFLLSIVHRMQALFSFDLRLEFVYSEDNVAADAASREEWGRFKSFMQSVGYEEDMIVWYDVNTQVGVRSETSSKMISMRRLQNDMLRERGTAGDQR